MQKNSSISDYFRTGAPNVWGGVKNFFTQPILTQTAIDAGLTQDSINRLTQFNDLLNDNVVVTSAYKQTMKGASAETKAMAREVANGTTKIGALSASSKAAALGMNVLRAALNAVFSIGIAWVVSKVASGIDYLAHAEENAIKAAKENVETTRNKVEEYQEQEKSLSTLVEKYKELRKAENVNNVDIRNQLVDLQEQITNLVGDEADNLDLVNGRLDEQLSKLKKIKKAKNADTFDAAETAYSAATEQVNTFAYHHGNSVFGNSDKNIVEFDFDEMIGNDNTILGNEIVDRVLKELKIGSATIDSGSFDSYYRIDFDPGSTLQQRLDATNKVLEELRTSTYDTSKDNGLYEELKKYRDALKSVVDDQKKSIQQLANIYMQQVVDEDYSLDNITSYKQYELSRKQIIRDVSRQASIQDALFEGVIKSQDIEDMVDNYLAELNNLSDYYDEWVRRNTNNYENMTDAEKAWAAEQSQHVKSASFAYEDYKDQINDVTKTLETLSSAYSKFSAGKAPASELMSLYDTFPELAQYGDDASILTEKIQELADTTVAPLVNSLSALGKTVKDPKQKAMIEGLVQSLKKMADLSVGIEKTADTVDKISDYAKYEEENVQKIIDKLEEQKDEQNDILDNLKAQKDELENIISEYEKVADTVNKYIDKTQIKPLEQQKSDIEEYYNMQIEKLKEENEERDRNIELQEKQDALANARKTKIKVYTESQGWTVQSDVKAIQNAEKELNDLQNEITIDNLEKQRDSEISDIEKQIKTWEDYKDAWKAQVEQITEADEELVASKILGADWHEKVADQDIDVMNNYGAEYVSYNNRLKNQVNVEISNMEKAIKAREKEITEWKDYKEQITDINKTITESNDTYLQNLNQFVIDENSTWEERIKHMERNAEIIAMLNGKANEIPETDAESILAGSKMWSITKDDSILGLYSSKEEAEADKKNVIQNLVKKQIAPGMPSSVIEIITKRIMESLHIKQYARGGISTKTGLSWLDGTSSGAEVIFNAAQAKQLYDIVANGNFGRMVSENILDGMKALVTSFGNKQSQPTPSSINISFPNATINAKDYDSFKNYMDRYTGELLLKMQVGL